MDYDRFKPPTKQAEEPPVENNKLYEQQPVKDYSYMVVDGKPSAPKKSHKLRTGLIMGLVVVLLAGAGFAAYQHFNKKSVVVTKTTTTSTSSQAKPKVTPTVPTTSYNSPNFNLSLNYPTGWTVAGDSAAILNVESPAMTLTTATGQTVTGKVIMSVQPKGQLPAAFGTADAEAVLDSQQVSYTSPTTDQRAQTYLSFVQYAATTTSGALDGIYVTGNYGYQKDQTIPRTDIASLDPLVTVTFGSCATAACTSLSTINIKASAWNDSSFQLPILTLLKSLAFD